MLSCKAFQVRIICRNLVGKTLLNSLKNKVAGIWKDNESISRSKKGIKMKKNKKKRLFIILVVSIKNRQRKNSNSPKRVVLYKLRNSKKHQLIQRKIK